MNVQVEAVQGSKRVTLTLSHQGVFTTGPFPAARARQLAAALVAAADKSEELTDLEHAWCVDL